MKYKKRTKKKTRRVKADKQVKKEIKQAVEKLPNLIYEHIGFEDKEPKQTKQHSEEPYAQPIDAYCKSRENKKRVIMWGAVTVISLIIFSLWAWNTKTVFQGLKNAPADNLATEAKTDLKIIMNSLAGENQPSAEAENDGEKIQNIKKSLKQSLSTLLNSSNGSTTATTTGQ